MLLTVSCPQVTFPMTISSLSFSLLLFLSVFLTRLALYLRSPPCTLLFLHLHTGSLHPLSSPSSPLMCISILFIHRPSAQWARGCLPLRTAGVEQSWLVACFIHIITHTLTYTLTHNNTLHFSHSLFHFLSRSFPLCLSD